MNQKLIYEELEQRVRDLENVKFLRKKALMELDETEDRYYLIYESILEAVLVADINRRIIDCNPAFTDLFGYALDEIIGKPTRCIYENEEESKKIGNKIKDCIDAQGFFIAARYRKKSGQVFPGEENVQYIKNSHGKVTGLIGSIRDITEREQKEKALRESEEKFRNLFQNHSAAKLIIDPDTGNIVEANRSAGSFYGWSVEQLKEMRIQDINVLSVEQVKAEMEKARSLKRTYFEFRHRLSDGSFREVGVYCAKIDIKGKALLHSIIHDITERTRTEEQKDRLVLELQKALSEIKTLSGLLPICSHCKKVRDDKGYWNQIETYIEDRSDTQFSHSICQECAKKYYPEMDLYDEDETQQ